MNIHINAAVRALIAMSIGYTFASTILEIPGWIGALYTAIILGMVILVIYLAAKENLQATFIETGEIKFVVRGEGLERVLENIDGFHHNEATGEIVEDHPGFHRHNTFLEEWLGIYWVSILYPIKRIHRYPFEWPKLLIGGHPHDSSKGGVVKIGGEGNYAIQHRDESVDSLYFRYTYPVYSEEVELKDNFKVDILLNVTFQIVFPAIPIFILKGKWLAPAMAAINGALADLVREYDLEGFRHIEKQAAGNPLETEVFKVNGEQVRDGEYGPGIIKSFGVKVHKVDFIKYDLSEKYREVVEASTAEKVAELKARAAIKTAEGAARTIELEQGAEAAMLRRLLEAASTHPMGGEVLVEQIKTKGLAAFQGQVLSLGGTPTGVMVNQELRKNPGAATAGATPTPEQTS